MKKILFYLGLVFFGYTVTAQSTNPKYDEALAKKLGADDYGMKSYVLVILKTGENTSKDEQKMTEAFNGHMANMNKMVEDGKLIVAGPIDKNENSYRGIFILNVPTLEEAKALLQTDPAIKAKYLAVDVYKWYGSAALPEYLPASDKIWKVGN